jgi:hypothetical protein
MKKIIIAAALIMVGCEKEEVKKEPIKDCNCDRIVMMGSNVLPMLLDNGTTKTIYMSTIFTVNDCSNYQQTHYFRSEYGPLSRRIGDCY